MRYCKDNDVKENEIFISRMYSDKIITNDKTEFISILNCLLYKCLMRKEIAAMHLFMTIKSR